MVTTRLVTRSLVGVAIATSLTVSFACSDAASGHPAMPGTSSSTLASSPLASNGGPSKKQLLHPSKDYYGVFAYPAPDSLSPIKKIATETGKTPNLDLWYQAWDSAAAKGTVNFDSAGAKRDCAAGILPMFTWESWDTSVTKTGEGVKYAQPAFSTKKIIGGTYDKYIRNMAKAIKAVNCPIAVRLDQEMNGYWYPWGLRTKGMGAGQDTPARYVAMWRHVWNIFHQVGATNVLWTWSPNYLPSTSSTQGIDTSYPGNKYVDWVGIDGYYYNDPNQTFAKLFGPTMTALKKFAGGKPWLIAETAVGTGPNKPKQITNLIDGVASHKQFNGFVYFDYYTQGLRSNWPFQETKTSQAAFKAAISYKAFASAKPGSL